MIRWLDTLLHTTPPKPKKQHKHLVLVNPHKHFLSDSFAHLPNAWTQALPLFDHISIVMFENRVPGPWSWFKNDKGAQRQECEHLIKPEIWDDNMILHITHGHSLPGTLLMEIEDDTPWKRTDLTDADNRPLVHLAGLQTDLNILIAAAELFDMGMNVEILKDLCGSTNATDHQRGLESLEKLLNKPCGVLTKHEHLNT